jgi:hypothetical protein
MCRKAFVKAQYTWVIIGIILGCLMCDSIAVPPAPPKKEKLVKDADVIAVVTVTSVEEKKVEKNISETAFFKVEQVIKGTLTLDERLSNTYSTVFPGCVGGRPLPKDTCLMFLKRENGRLFVADYYGTWLIKDGKLKSWLADDPLRQKWPEDVSLSNVIEEIKAIMSSDTTAPHP